LTKILAAAELAVKIAGKKGFDEAEAFATEMRRRDIVFRNAIEATRNSTTAGISVRGVVGRRIGFFSTSSLERSDIEKAVDESLRIAKANDEDHEWRSLPREYGKANVQKIIDKNIEYATPKALVDEVHVAISTVRQVGSTVYITRGFLLTNVMSNAVANSHGCKLERKETLAVLSLAVRAGTAEKKGVSNEFSVTRQWKALGTRKLAREAAERAVKMKDATHMPNGKLNTVWRNDAFAAIIDAMLTRTITADAVQKNRSPWAGKIGQQVASEAVTIIDEGRMVAGNGTREFDDDGIPQTRTPIIERGVLTSFLYDNYTANKEDRLSTGNAHRDVGTFGAQPNYAKSPTPYPNNFIVQAGDATVQEVIEETRNGLYVVSTIGEWLSNPISGDLSATLSSGFLIEHGELTKPVKGAILTSNFFNILKGKMDLRAKDLRSGGTVYAPTTQVTNMTVAGE
jgi:PmbA protein